MPYRSKQKQQEAVKRYREKNRTKLRIANRLYKQQNQTKIKQYRQEHKKQIKKTNQNYYQKNKDTFLEKNRVYILKNKDRISEQNKKRYNRNKKKILSYQKQYYLQNSEEIKKRTNQYYKNNKEQIKKRNKKAYFSKNCPLCKQPMGQNSKYCRNCFCKNAIAPNKLFLNEVNIIQLYPKFSVPTIAKKFDCSIEVIYRILKENNIPIKESAFFLKGKRNSPQTEFKPGSLSINWQGGKSFEPYTYDFNKRFKESIRRRDSYCCVVCNKPQKGLKCKLTIHHTDYNKLNTIKENCVSLCNKCHGLTNYNRNSWGVYFKKLLFERYGYTTESEQTALSNFGRVTGENLAY